MLLNVVIDDQIEEIRKHGVEQSLKIIYVNNYQRFKITEVFSCFNQTAD